MRLIIILILLHISIIARSQTSSFVIEGKISGWKNTEKLALFYDVDGTHVSDTVDAINGSFKFVGKNDKAVEAKVVCISNSSKGLRDLRTFYLDAGKITIKGTDALKSANVSGGGATADYEKLHATLSPLMDAFLQIRIRGMKMTKAQQGSPEYNALVKENTDMIATIYETKKAFVLKHPASIVSMNTVLGMMQGAFNVDKVEPLYAALSPSLKKSKEGMNAGKSIVQAKTTRIGAVLPNFSALDTLGKPLSLAEVVKKGKVTLVDFWASWCIPCRAENPNVVKAFNAFRDKGFNILSVSLDRTADSWKKAIVKDGMPWYHISSLKFWDEPAVIQLGITGIPDSFLLDAEGKVIARGLRGEDLYKKIQETLN